MKKLLILILAVALLATLLTACETPKICDVCGKETTDCKDDTRLHGENEPVPVCADCRAELDRLEKICSFCGEEKNDCKYDTRLYGEDEPAPVCADCREILDALFEE